MKVELLIVVGMVLDLAWLPNLMHNDGRLVTIVSCWVSGICFFLAARTLENYEDQSPGDRVPTPAPAPR